MQMALGLIRGLSLPQFRHDELTALLLMLSSSRRGNAKWSRPFPIHGGYIQQSPESVDLCVSIRVSYLSDDLLTAVQVKANFSTRPGTPHVLS